MYIYTFVHLYIAKGEGAAFEQHCRFDRINQIVYIYIYSWLGSLFPECAAVCTTSASEVGT